MLEPLALFEWLTFLVHFGWMKYEADEVESALWILFNSPGKAVDRGWRVKSRFVDSPASHDL